MSSKNPEFQLKSFTPIDDYKFTLSDELKAFVEKEFRETDEIRSHAIKDLREWAVKNPRIVQMRLDSNFLLRFLRCRKFSLPMTKEMIERFLLLRAFKLRNREAFKDLDVRNKVVQELLNKGFIFFLPQSDALGRRKIFYRVGIFDPCIYSSYDLIKIISIFLESLLEDEENQIKGFVHLVDVSGSRINLLSLFTPTECIRVAKNLEKIVPIRHKEIHIFNVHPTVKFLVNFAISRMDKKMQKRTIVHRNVEDLTKFVDVNLLPAEYGGKVPMSEMIKLCHKELEEKRDKILAFDETNINLELYPRPVCDLNVRSMKTSIESWDKITEKSFESYGLQGSFRNLNID